MAKDKPHAFFDTNVLIYAFAKGDRRAHVAEALLAGGGFVSVQILNEFVSVAVRKLSMPWADVLDGLAAIRALCQPPVPLTIKVHEAGLVIAQKYGYHIYDSLVLAAAEVVGCDTVYSEDLQDGQQIGGVTIQNPFRRAV